MGANEADTAAPNHGKNTHASGPNGSLPVTEETASTHGRERGRSCRPESGEEHTCRRPERQLTGDRKIRTKPLPNRLVMTVSRQRRHRRRMLPACLIAIVASLLNAGQAMALSCNITPISGGYGVVDILAGAAVNGTASLTVTCTAGTATTSFLNTQRCPNVLRRYLQTTCMPIALRMRGR